MPMNTVLEGPLSKWTNMLSGWQYRWFVLDPLNGLLSYYTSKENMSKGERRGCIRLNKGAVYVGYDNEDDITFTITVDEKTFHLQARNLDEREKWVNKIDRTIRYHTATSGSNYEKKDLLSNDEVINSIILLSDLDISFSAISSGPQEMSKFDNELAESDAYLQLLIEQLKGLETKRTLLLESVENIPKNSPAVSNTAAKRVGSGNYLSNELSILDPNLNSLDGRSDSVSESTLLHGDTSEAEKFQSIIFATESLIETLKHAIICLQIAKANSDPNSSVGELANDLNEVISNLNKPHPTPNDSLNTSLRLSDSTTNANNNSENCNNENLTLKKKLQTLNQLITLKEELGTEKKPDNAKNEHKKATTLKTSQNFESYSSSEDEEIKSVKTELKVDETQISSKAEFGSLVVSNDKNTVHKNINDDDDDEENLSDYFNDDEDEDCRRKSRADDNDSESFYDAIDPTVTVTSYNSTENSEMYHQAAIVTRVLCGEEAKPKDEIIQKYDLESFSAITSNKALQADTELMQQDLSSRGLIMIDKKLISDSELYDDDAVPEEIDLNNQQSVITHLLTQVRIGMDLTKITLPTFILEPRSLLEMYADFFAHTDLFLEIVDKKNAHDRMVQVMKWYLSTLHAGRKSPVAKKPYNPILGEIFQCWYSIPQLETNESSIKESDKTPAADGPVKWATRDQLSFIAEQVSHHPPISAFYAEHFNKRIQIDGYTWTKSKFLGLSIGVHFIGKAVLSLLDFDEEYVMTFPSAYGRSILSVPWFEMGGQVTVTCAKTGYSSNIEFLTKPFYGGKKHQIQGTIMGPDKKTLYSIDGDWNGTIFIKGTRKEVLIATQSTPTIRKQVRPLVDQTDNESRRLWREVTYFLRTKQIDRATSAKQKIEQLQREMVKYRKENNIKWQPKNFVEDGENWVYINPLVKRLQTSEVTATTSTSTVTMNIFR